MATYYDRLTGGISAGAYLDVYSVTTSATKTKAAIAGGWHTFGGAWYVEYIDNSLGYFEGGNDHPLVASSGNRVWGAYDEEFNSTTASFTRGSSDRTITLYSYIYCYVNGMNRDARATCDITVPHLPNAPTSLTATRVTDNSVALSWTAPTRTADGIALEVQIDGGSWSAIATIASGTSYTWNGASADHSYKFRARASYKGAWSGYSSATTAVVMTPAAPTSIATAAAGGTTVDVTLVNASPVATSVEYQVSTDGGSTWGASATSSNLTSFSVTISGTGKIRVRNVNATGSSAWLVSETVTTICPPAAPTPRTPSGIVDMDAANVTFGWLFNSIDGSAQTAYELKYARNGGAAVTLTGTTAKSRDVAMTTFSAGDSVSWQVRTKGADPNWSEWSSSQTFYVYTAPTVSITAPGATITGMPINLTATYSDMPGFTCAAATASLTQGGRMLYSEPADINGSAITASLDVAEFLPTNGESYTVVLDVRSSSSLQGTANATFLVDFTEPAAGTLQVDNDGETGYVSLTALFDNHATDVTYDGTAGTGVEVQSAAIRSLEVDGMSVQDGTPTPDNPIPIQVVEGANLFDPSLILALSNWSESDGVYTGNSSAWGTVSSSNLVITLSGDLTGRQFTVSFDAYVDYANSRAGYCRIIYTDATADNIEIIGQEWKHYTKTTNANKTVSSILFLNSNSRSTSIKNPQLTESAYEQPYVPYGALGLTITANGQTTVTPIDLQGNVLASLPDGTKDVLTVDPTGHVTLTKNVGVVTLDGSNSDGSWYVSAWGDNRRFHRLTVNGADATTSEAYVNMLCNRFAANTIVVSGNPSLPSAVGQSALYADKMYFVVESTTANDVAAWKTWLTANNMAVFYPLATPTTVDLGYIEMPDVYDGAVVDVMASLPTSFELVGYDGSADAVSISVLRVNADGTTTQLLADGESGTGIVDKYAPLNTNYQYAVVTRAASQAVRTVYVDNLLASVHWFAYWADKIARATWNPSGQTSISRPEKKRVHYVGREYPVSYDTLAIDQQNSMSWTLLPADEADGFRELMCDGGRGVYKGCDGQVFHADFEYTSSADFWHITRNEQVSLTITRIDGEQL